MCTTALLRFCWGFKGIVFTAPICFSLAHYHHIVDMRRRGYSTRMALANCCTCFSVCSVPYEKLNALLFQLSRPATLTSLDVMRHFYFWEQVLYVGTIHTLAVPFLTFWNYTFFRKCHGTCIESCTLQFSGFSTCWRSFQWAECHSEIYSNVIIRFRLFIMDVFTLAFDRAIISYFD